MPELGDIKVTMNGNISIEGGHRCLAAEETDMPIVFTLVGDYTTNEIAAFNNSRSSAWKNEPTFESALKENACLALTLFELRVKLTDKYGLTEKQLGIGEIYAILTKNNRYFGVGLNVITRPMYFDKKLNKKAQSSEYFADLDNYAFIRANYLNENMAYKIAKSITQCSFESMGEVTQQNCP